MRDLLSELLLVLSRKLQVSVSLLRMRKLTAGASFSCPCHFLGVIKMENIKFRQNKPINKKHIKYAITAGVLCLTIMFSSLGIIIKNNIEAANILEFVPAKSNAVLTSSPGMGLAPWADSEETLNLDTTLVYVELKWSDW